MAAKKILVAGFGGQGILFAGKFLAYLGIVQGKEVSWLPSYGPEMRGGSSNCSVIISDKQIGSPIVDKPDLLICMNLPSFVKYSKSLADGGLLFVDSSLADVPDESKMYKLPATKLAKENELTGLANMIMLGKLMKETDLCGDADRDGLIASVLKKCVPERKKDLFDANVRALNIGLGD